MARSVIPDADFIHLFKEIGPAQLAIRSGIAKRNVFERREKLERMLGCKIQAPKVRYSSGKPRQALDVHPQRSKVEIRNGHALVGSDAHYWPGEASVAHRAFVAFAKEYKPQLICQNGDVIDACTISRHPPIGWESRPPLIEEIEAAQDRMHEIEKVTPKGCRRTWNLGNHDSRFETRLATVAPEFAKLQGVHLKDHFPLWEPAWATWVNGEVVIKHRWKGGIHATHNNTVNSGLTMITGHLHSQKVTPFTDYRGTRWGVDTGCLADTDGKQFVDYTEDSPKNWRAGFALLTFDDGVLLPPELVMAWDAEHVAFRGKLIRV